MIIFVLFFSIVGASIAAELELKDILKSTENHYPKILASLQNMESQKFKVESAEGAFDLKMKGKGDARTRGYYDGRNYDLSLEKPLFFANSYAYTGFRQSRGEVPLYEGKSLTLSEGEVRAGLGFSILQDFLIDEKRSSYWNAKFEAQIAEQNYTNEKFKSFKLAAKAYANWVTAGKLVEVNRDLVSLIKNRESSLQKRVDRGDLARIYLDENAQYLVKRQADLVSSEMDFQQASIELSLFWRDENGQMVIPTSGDLPQQIWQISIKKDEQLKPDLAKLLMFRPELRELELNREQQILERRLGDNKLIPKLDFQLEVNRDNGAGPNSYRSTENRAFLTLEIPLERRLGRGKSEAAKAKIGMIDRYIALAKDELKTKLETIYIKINKTVEKIGLSEKEINLALKLQKAEEAKFFSGDSDYFLVNIREQNTATARIKYLLALNDYLRYEADYRELMLDFSSAKN